MNIWNVLRWNFLHQACMHPCKHVIWKFLVKALQRLPDHFVKFWNYMQLYKVWNKGLVLLSVSLSWEYVYYILSLSYGWNETVMFQWKLNLGDVILVSSFLTLGIPTVVVLANQLEPEKYEYWFKTFVLSCDLYMTKVGVTLLHFLRNSRDYDLHLSDTWTCYVLISIGFY